MTYVSSGYSDLPMDNLKTIAQKAYLGAGICKRWQAASKAVEDDYFTNLGKKIESLIPFELNKNKIVKQEYAFLNSFRPFSRKIIFQLYVDEVYRIAIALKLNSQITEMIPQDNKQNWGKLRLKWEIENFEKVAIIVCEKAKEHLFQRSYMSDAYRGFNLYEVTHRSIAEVTAQWEVFMSEEGEEDRDLYEDLEFDGQMLYFPPSNILKKFPNIIRFELANSNLSKFLRNLKIYFV